MLNIELVLIGLVVGILIGLTGIGGGVLMTPILVIVMGVQPSIAIGTDLLFAAVTKVIGALQYWHLKTVDLGIATCLALGSIPAVLVGTFAVKGIKDTFGSSAESILSQILAVALILGAVMMFARILWSRLVNIKMNGLWSLPRQQHQVLTVLLGFVSGLLVSLTSIGAGSLIMLFLILLYPMRTSRLVGTDIFHAAILASIAAMGHYWVGNVNLSLAGTLLLGSIPGVLIGSVISARVPDNALRFVLATTLLFSGIRLMVR